MKITLNYPDELLETFADKKGYISEFTNPKRENVDDKTMETTVNEDEPEKIPNPQSKTDFAISLIMQNVKDYVSQPMRKELKDHYAALAKKNEEKKIAELNAQLDQGLTID